MLCGAECKSVVHTLWECSTYHKGALAPLYIGSCGLASIAPIHSENPRFRGNRHSIRNPSTQKGTYGQNMGVLKK